MNPLPKKINNIDAVELLVEANIHELLRDYRHLPEMQFIIDYILQMHRQLYTKGEGDVEEIATIRAPHALIEVTVVAKQHRLKIANRVEDVIIIF
jgi:hypothetical protein